MKNVLIVDDDKSFLLSLADMFKPYRNTYTIYTAYNGIEAIEVLSQKQIDLVVTDLKMPEMDGFGLLAHMSGHNAGIPVIVMTAFSSPETSDRLDTFGIFQFIEKPVDFDQLHEKIQNTLKSGSKGHIAGVSLASFLQLLGLDSKTCTLKVTSNDRVGVLYFRQGELFDAFTGNLRGLNAALDIVGWEPVEIEIDNFCRKNKRMIEEPLGFILIEGARRKDERSEDKPADEESPEEVLTDIDFNVAAPPPDIDIVEEAAAISGGGDNIEAQSAAALLISSAESIEGLQKMVVSRRDGEVLAEKNADSQFSTFICKTALETLGLGIALNLDDPHYIALSLETNRKLIVLFGPDVILGMDVPADAAPAAIRANLNPILKRTKFD